MPRSPVVHPVEAFRSPDAGKMKGTGDKPANGRTASGARTASQNRPRLSSSRLGDRYGKVEPQARERGEHGANAQKQCVVRGV